MPCKDLFNSEDLFHLSFSDSERGEEDVDKAGPKATAAAENGKLKSASAIPTTILPTPSKTTCDAAEPTRHTTPAPDVITSKVCNKSPAVELLGEIKFSEKCLNQSKLADKLYNSKNLNCGKAPTSLLTTTQAKLLDVAQTIIPRNPSPQANRFPITMVNVRYYDILCGLAHSQWKGQVAVEFVKTKVNFESLGESIEPGGHCDSFFIAGHCRNFFELCHPRQSRKHYFYPSVGYSMLRIDNHFHEKIVRHSFLGGNSALKLHLSDKLCFPICHECHWFVFLVDLKGKYFVFMDSVYDQFDKFQTGIRDTIIVAFKTAWAHYAEGNVDFSEFTIYYPPVPKQTTDCDGGIFGIKNMELWEEHIDLRQRFGQADMGNLRVILGNDLYFSPKNQKDKSLVNRLFKSGIDPRAVP